jgi:hypothetical protein
MTTLAAVPRWADGIARTVPLLVLPSGLWRIALGVGVPMGFSGELAELFHAPGWITPYVFTLSLLVEALALLTLGLVRPWGEVVPRWVPWVGGRVVPVRAAVAAGALGAVAVTVVSVVSAAVWFGPDNMGDPDSPHGWQGALMTACYAPQLLWGPLLAVVTWAYLRRRRQS